MFATTLIRTLSGATYVVNATGGPYDPHYVTRVGAAPVHGLDDGDAIVGRELDSFGVPLTGCAWRFRTVDGLVVSTSTVTDVTCQVVARAATV